MTQSRAGLAIVTGASSGIGRELAGLCAAAGYDLVVAADERSIEESAHALRGCGVRVDALNVDLATAAGVDCLHQAVRGRRVDALLANAGHGLGGPFLDQDFTQARHVIDTNVTGTLDLIQRVGRDMRAQGRGRILITGSIAGFIPGTFNAVYNGTKAFIDSFAAALRDELKETGVTVTCLMPGPTQTRFFERANLADTKVGQGRKDNPADVARTGFDAMLKGEADVVSGLERALEAVAAPATPSGIRADPHRRQTTPVAKADRI